MAKIKFDLEITKVAVIPTQQGPARIGVVAYEEENNGVRSIMIDIDKDVPQNLLEEIQKRPEVISLAEQVSAPKNFILIPGIVL